MIGLAGGRVPAGSGDVFELDDYVIRGGDNDGVVRLIRRRIGIALQAPVCAGSYRGCRTEKNLEISLVGVVNSLTGPEHTHAAARMVFAVIPVSGRLINPINHVGIYRAHYRPSVAVAAKISRCRVIDVV